MPSDILLFRETFELDTTLSATNTNEPLKSQHGM